LVPTNGATAAVRIWDEEKRMAHANVQADCLAERTSFLSPPEVFTGSKVSIELSRRLGPDFPLSSHRHIIDNEPGAPDSYRKFDSWAVSYVRHIAYALPSVYRSPDLLWRLKSPWFTSVACPYLNLSLLRFEAYARTRHPGVAFCVGRALATRFFISRPSACELRVCCSPSQH